MILHINKLDVIMQQQPIENTAVSMTGPACRSVLTAGRATTRAARFFLFFFSFLFFFFVFFLLAAVLLFQRKNKTLFLCFTIHEPAETVCRKTDSIWEHFHLNGALCVRKHPGGALLGKEGESCRAHGSVEHR